MNRPIYLDHHATTPLAPEVLEAMMPYLTDHYGNASSSEHAFGWRAEEAVALAREQVAGLVGCAPREIVFTSGATGKQPSHSGYVPGVRQEGPACGDSGNGAPSGPRCL